MLESFSHGHIPSDSHYLCCHRRMHRNLFERLTFGLWQMDAILKEQSIVDWCRAELGCESVAGDVGNHQWKNDGVVVRHLEDNDDGRYRSPHNSREYRSHPD